MITQQELHQYFEYKNGPEGWGLYWITHKNNTRNLIGKRFGCTRADGYRCGRFNSKPYREHRLIWLYLYNEWPDEVDHIDRNRSNNKTNNLRNVNKCLNQQNTVNRGGKSQYKGVYHDQGKWVARIYRNGERYYLGRFETEHDANMAIQEF